MSPARLQQIEDLFHQALATSVEQRRAFVERASGHDHDLREEVLSLLEVDLKSQLLETPAADLAAELAAFWPPAPDLDAPARRHPFWWFAFAACVALAVCLGFCLSTLVRYGGQSKDYGWTASLKGGAFKVQSVDPHGPAAGKLMRGDRVLEINGDRRGSRLGNTLLHAIRPSSSYTLRVGRDTGEYLLQLSSTVKQSSRNLVFIISLLLVGIVYAMVGLLTGFMRPGQESARYFCLMAVATSLMWFRSAIEPSDGLLSAAEFLSVLLMDSGGPFILIFGYWFCYRFPPGTPTGRFWTRAGYAISIWYGCFWLVRTWNGLAALQTPWAVESLYRHYELQRALLQTFGQTQVFYYGLCAAVLFRNHRRVKDAGHRRRLKWVTAGLAAGFLPIPILDILIPAVARSFGHPLDPQIRFQLWWLSMITSILMPLSVAYGILKHRVFDFDVVIRLGVRYLLAKNGLRFALAVLVLALGYSIAAQSERPLRDIALHGSTLFYLLLIATLAFSIAFRYRLMDWVDRSFFREAYSQEKILRGLTAEIGTLASLDELSARVTAEIEAALHTKNIYLFFRDAARGELTLSHSMQDSLRGCVIPASWTVVDLIESTGASRDMLSLRGSNLPLDERFFLSRLRVELLVPMRGSNARLAGLLLLGAKRSEEPYNLNDRQVLEALGVQMALVCENVRLKDDLYKGKRIQHEVLSRFDRQQIHLLKECPSCGACADSGAEICPSDGATLALTMPIERTLDGRYRLERLLGKGGMGSVYAGEDLRMRRKVAVKVILGNMFGNPIALRRFAREGQAVARLRHPNIVTVFDYGELHSPGGSGAYLVMELVDGISLRTEMQGAHTRGIPAWFFQLLAGVGAAHEQGVVHRDLKPENVLISRMDSGAHAVKILDFGLAKIISEQADYTLTAAGVPLGTLGYMSPEQLRGEPVDHRSDIFSLGVILAEWLTGERIFKGRSVTELLRSMEERSSIGRGLPGHVTFLAAIQRCIAIRPEDRFDSVAEFENALIPKETFSR